MPITLTPEQEAEIRQDAAALGYERAEDYLSVRLANLHARASFSFETEEEFDRLVEEGIESADRGELYSLDEVKADLEAFKEEFLRSKRSAA